MLILTNIQKLAELGRQMGRLEQLNLIRLAAAQPELEYTFCHALLQEGAYQSLLRADRRRIHLAAGQALESLAADKPPSAGLWLQLARHFAEASDQARAVHYYTL